MSFKALPVKIERTAVKKPTEGGGGGGRREGHRQESPSSKILLSIP